VTVAPDATTSMVSGITAWLQGSTSIAGYSIPNPLLVAAVVLGFAFLSSSGKAKK
jgi:hypothetical protein